MTTPALSPLSTAVAIYVTAFFKSLPLDQSVRVIIADNDSNPSLPKYTSYEGYPDMFEEDLAKLLTTVRGPVTIATRTADMVPGVPGIQFAHYGMVLFQETVALLTPEQLFFEMERRSFTEDDKEDLEYIFQDMGGMVGQSVGDTSHGRCHIVQYDPMTMPKFEFRRF